ncbi:MAG: mandelate racemase/muconate lactonizing enzyme family protein, partial [Deltaproteobacteria bacterium]|nr:mandelate racemase/muconate lactonizing enzyme family protein [Deltaproteobacteria bacterium]
GRKRENIKVYASGMYFSKAKNLPQVLAKEALSYKRAGFGAMKMKVGLGGEEDVKNVRAVREALGPDVALMVDANHAFSFHEALKLARAIEDYDITWFEEPLIPEDYDGYRELRKRTSIPIAGGECEFLRAGFLNLFKNRSVDIAQPDICAAGGITEVKKIAGFAQAFGVELTPHCWGAGIALSAALHFMSNWDVIPGRLREPEPLLEFDRTENPLREELVKPQFVVKDGRITAPEHPGLGVDIDETILRKYSL